MYFNYGEIHIILNQRINLLRRKYGTARRHVSEIHLNELQRIVDIHPEYYLDEFVMSLARVTGVFIILLQYPDYLGIGLGILFKCYKTSQHSKMKC